MGNTGLADFVLIVTQRICKNLIVFHKHRKICLWIMWTEMRQKAAWPMGFVYLPNWFSLLSRQWEPEERDERSTVVLVRVEMYCIDVAVSQMC